MNAAGTDLSPEPARAHVTVPLRPLLGGMLGLAVAMGIGRFAYTPLLPAMESAAHLDAGQAGFLASANYAGYLAGALILTLVVPGAAHSRLLGVSLIAVAVTTAVIAGTTNFAAWSVIRFLSGLASAGVFILTSDAILGFLRREGRTGLSGWLYGGVGIGIVASGVVGQVAGGREGWRYGWLALAVLAALAVYPAWRWVSPEPLADVNLIHRPVGRRLRARAPLALLLAAYTLAGAGYIITGTFLVAIVDRMPGLTGFGAGVWIVVGLAAIPSAALWVAAGARIGYAPALAMVYLTQACGVLLPALAGGAAAALAAAALYGGTFMAISALTLTIAGRLAPHRSATVIGLLTAGFGVGQIVAPPLAGIVAGPEHDFRPALTAAAAVVLLCSVLAALLSRQQGIRDPRQGGQAA